MKKTNNKRETVVACGGDIDVNDKNQLALKHPILGLSKKEMDQRSDNMIIETGSFEVVRDPKTGKLLRIKNNKTISEVNKDKYDRLLSEFKNKQHQDGQDR